MFLENNHRSGSIVGSNIKSVNLASDIITIEGFTVFKGDLYKNKYTLHNLSVKIKANKPGNQTIDSIILILSDGTKIECPIGKINIEVLTSSGEYYPVTLAAHSAVTSNRNAGFFTLKNNTSDPIQVELYFNVPDVLVDQQNKIATIGAQEESIMNLSLDFNKKNIDFVAIKPLLIIPKSSYRDALGGGNFFGLLNIDDDIIEQMLTRQPVVVRQSQ